MKKTILYAALSAAILSSCAKQPSDLSSRYFSGETPTYEEFFTPERLRIDLSLSGNSTERRTAVKGLYRESAWSGSPASLIDTRIYGNYYIEAFEGERLIYSGGFCSLFEEWLSTSQAKEITMEGGQSVWMPFPRRNIRVVISQKLRSGTFEPLLSIEIDPTDRHIVFGPQNDFPVKQIICNGDPKHKVDLAFIAEGYRSDEMDKFEKDAAAMAGYILDMDPYCKRKGDFNVYLVECSSTDSGVSIPQDSIWKRTALGSMFDTFYTDRYLTIMDHTRIAAAASSVPFDALIVVANDPKYGGGGFYNSYAMGTSDNKYSLEVIAHEFGHSFAALGDEYYDSQVAYEDYYPAGVEPWEPNITTQVRFETKWKDMVESGEAGLFEGAGYQAKGCWRGSETCRMLRNDAPGFCPVCRRAIDRMIDFYTK